MKGFHINKLTVSGHKGESSIDFGPTTTIIAGPSDTGKSYVFWSIDYLMGAEKEELPFDSSIGYSKLSMTISTDKGTLTLSRELGSNSIDIISGIEKIKSKRYPSKTVNYVIFPTLFDIPNELKIPRNVNGELSAFTWRTIIRSLMVKEKYTETDNSIILPEQFTAQTHFLSCLLYLLYNQDFSSFDPEDSKKDKAVKKAAVQQYIIGQREFLQGRVNELNEKMKTVDGNADPVKMLADLQQQLADITGKIDKAIEDNQTLAKDIIATTDSLHQSALLLDRYSTLDTQYESDIKRLSFITENDQKVPMQPKVSHCPFCDSPVKTETRSSYLEAAKVELRKTIENANGLSSSIDDIKNDIASFKEKLSTLNAKKADVNKAIEEVLKPKKDEISSKISDYEEYISLKSQLSAASSFDVIFKNDLGNVDKKIEMKTSYKPLDLFPNSFFEFIGKRYLSILKECKYTPALSASLDPESFDMIINGSKKKSHGKGVCAFLNSLLFLSLKEYIEEKGAHNPGFFMIDSPLHGLNIPKEDTENTESNIRRGLFNYIVKNNKEDQLIVIENIEETDLSDADCESFGAKVIRFSGKEGVGRYGFLDGIRRN